MVKIEDDEIINPEPNCLKSVKTLAICPCGKVPDDVLMMDGFNAKWAYVAGSCCGEWSLEFRTQREELCTQKCKDYAIAAWNKAPRGGAKNVNII